MKEKTVYQPVESVVLTGEEWRTLRFRRIEKGTLKLTNARHAFVSEPVEYEEGADFEVDYEAGRIRRLAGSSIPDFCDNRIYKAPPRSVDLANFPDFDAVCHGARFTAIASYRYEAGENENYGDVLDSVLEKNKTALPIKLAKKIREGKNLIYGVVGDSISTGADAMPGEDFFSLFAGYIERFGVKVEICNVAVGGMCSDDAPSGIDRLYRDKAVVPDLLSFGYGMNDMNSLGNDPWTSPEAYVRNMQEAIERIGIYTDQKPEIILITSMPANPVWNYTSGAWMKLGDALRGYALEKGYPLADAGALFASELKHGKTYEELIISLINHPGNYGHYLYFLTLKKLLDEALKQI